MLAELYLVTACTAAAADLQDSSQPVEPFIAAAAASGHVCDCRKERVAVCVCDYNEINNY